MAFTLFTLQYVCEMCSSNYVRMNSEARSEEIVTRDNLFRKAYSQLLSMRAEYYSPLHAWVLSTMPERQMEHDR